MKVFLNLFWLSLGFLMALPAIAHDGDKPEIDIFQRPTLRPNVGQLFRLGEFPYDRENLIRRLRSNPSIKVVGKMHPSLEMYLSILFDLIPPEKGLIVKQSKNKLTGSLVSSRRTKNSITLEFSNDAQDALYTHQLSLFYNEYIKTATKPTESDFWIKIRYDNELALQLIPFITTPQGLKKRMTNIFGIRFEAKPSDPYRMQYVEFSHTELATIFKELVDLPESIRSKLNLFEIVRWAHGYHPPGSAAGSYGTGTIHLNDWSFSPRGDALGEDVILHELGHALWFGALTEEVRAAYQDLSWTKNTEGLRIKVGEDYFVTAYAKTNPGEDFAEHFADYVYNRERIEKLARKKFDWLFSNIFDSVYFTYGYEKFEVVLISEDADTEAPKIDSAAIDAMTTGCKLDKAKLCTFGVSLAGIKDEKSGIKEVVLTYKSPEDPTGFRIDLNDLDLMNPKRGLYERFKDQWFSLPEDRKYCVSTITVLDRSAKSTTYDNLKTGCVTIPKTVVSKTKQPPPPLTNETREPGRILNAPSEEKPPGPNPVFRTSKPYYRALNKTEFLSYETEGKKGYLVSMPIPHKRDIDNIVLQFTDDKGGHFKFEVPKEKFLTKYRDRFIKFKIVFPQEMSTRNIRLNSFTILKRGFDMNYGLEDRENLRVAHQGGEDRDILLDTHRITVLKDPNCQAVLRTEVSVKVPGTYPHESFAAYFRAPDGKVDLIGFDLTGKEGDIRKYKADYCVPKFAPNGNYVLTQFYTNQNFFIPEVAADEVAVTNPWQGMYKDLSRTSVEQSVIATTKSRPLEVQRISN